MNAGSAWTVASWKSDSLGERVKYFPNVGKTLILFPGESIIVNVFFWQKILFHNLFKRNMLLSLKDPVKLKQLQLLHWN